MIRTEQWASWTGSTDDQGDVEKVKGSIPCCFKLSSYTTSMVWKEPCWTLHGSQYQVHSSTKSLLIPQWTYLPEFRKRNTDFKEKQKVQFNRQHRVLEQDSIPDGSDVWIMSESDTVPGTVVSAGENPQSYIVETPTGKVQRNRSHLNVVPDSSTEEQSSTEAKLD